MKICSKCKIEKDLNEFHISKLTKDGYQYICKQCKLEYYKNNYKIISKQQYKYRKENKEIRIKYRNGKANYNIFASQIFYADKVRNIDGFLQTKCTYCGKWYFPIVKSIENRIAALKGRSTSGAEQRLYCSEECKEACPIYHKIKFQEGHPKLDENNQVREVQPELRQMVFERDNYTCLKCGKHQDELNVPLHCHHKEGIRWNPLESADIDECMTVCKDCHIEIHKQTDCGYNDLQCKE